MAGDIVLSGSVRSNLLSLQNTADLMSRTQNRLATGKKVNSALDNPTNFFIAGSLTNRATDISNLLDGVGTAMKVLEGADNGIKAITRLVENAQAAARQAQQSTPSTARLTGTVTGLTASTNLVSLGFTATDTITITTGATNAVLTVGAGSTVQNLVDAINTDPDVQARASITSDGRLLLEATGTTALSITATDTTDLAAIGFTNGTNSSAAAGTINTTRTSFANQYNELRNQIDKLAGDATYNGVNLLQSDALKVIFNEHTTSYLTITGVDFDAAGLGVTAAGNSLQTDFDVNKALSELGTALTSLRSQASTFGSNLSVVQTRQEFMKSMINTLKTGSDQLVLADTNEEGANMLALQTRQQLSSTALSLASQAEQQVMRLFG